MINFNFNTGFSSNPLTNLKPRVRGVDDTRANLQSATNSSVNSNKNTNSNTNINLSANKGINSTSTINSAQSTSANKVLGYEVDSKGYFTDEFNKAAGIPSDYKIHSSAAQSIVNVALNKGDNDISLIARMGFLNVDIAQTFANAYKILSQVVGESVLSSKDSFTQDEIAQFPQGYYYDKDLSVKKVYNSIYDFFDAVARFDNKKGTDEMSLLFYNETISDERLKPATNILSNSNGGKESNFPFNFDTAKDKHTNADGSITKGGLLVAIINQNKALIEGETNISGKLNGFDRNINGNELSLWMHSLPLTIAMFDNPEIQALQKDLLNTSDISEIKSKFLNIKRRSQEIFDTGRAKEKKLEENYKDPIAQMLEEIIIRLKEQTQKALERQRENAKKSTTITNIEKVDIKA